MTVYTDNEQSHAMMNPYVRPAGPPLALNVSCLFVSSVNACGILLERLLKQSGAIIRIPLSYVLRSHLCLHQNCFPCYKKRAAESKQGEKPEASLVWTFSIIDIENSFPLGQVHTLRTCCLPNLAKVCSSRCLS